MEEAFTVLDPDTIDPSTVATRRDDLASVEIDGETVMYDPVARLLHHLDVIATAIWSELDGVRDLAAIAATLAAEFGTDVDTVTSDVVALLRQLAADGLLRAGDPLTWP